MGHGQSFVARQDDPLKDVVGFDFLFHLGLDLFEVFGRDAVVQFEIVIEAVFDRWTRGELRIRPDLENGRGQDVGSRMPQTLDVGHLRAFFVLKVFSSRRPGCVWRGVGLGLFGSERLIRDFPNRSPFGLCPCRTAPAGSIPRPIRLRSGQDFRSE